MSKKVKDNTPDAYDENERSISIEDAHRDVVYDIASSFRQTLACCSMQMKLFSKKTFSIIIFFILLAAIPIVIYLAPSMVKFPTVNENMVFALCLLPVMAVIFSCSSCGKMLPREYHERTIYLTAPLPMYKSSLFIGKFLAGFFLTAGKVILAYGVALVSCRFLTDYTPVYYIPILLSLAITLCAVFFYCAFTYMMSAGSKRGSTAGPFIAIFLLMTGAAYGLSLLAIHYEIPFVTDIVGYMPSLSCDFALTYLGGDNVYGSIYGILGIFGANTLFSQCDNIFISCGVNVLLGIICLAIGYRKISRRKI